LPDASNGVPVGADMSWLNYGCQYGQPQRQNQIQKIGWSQGASWESPAIVEAINLFLKIHSFNTDLSGGPAAPPYQRWSTAEEFLNWSA
jgi:hypothetical protein